MEVTFNPFVVLNVSCDATVSQIKSAHRKLARRFHPDTGGRFASSVEFRQVSQAYKILMDPVQREYYRDLYFLPPEVTPADTEDEVIRDEHPTPQAYQPDPAVGLFILLLMIIVILTIPVILFLPYIILVAKAIWAVLDVLLEFLDRLSS